jgi:hypothetical protein
MSMNALTGNLPDPALLPRLLPVFGEVRALKCLGVISLPDVGIALGINLKIKPPLFIENIRKPRIVPPSSFHHDGIIGLLGSQEVIDGVALAAGIPVRPEL